jgi:hypothetical protein
MKLLHPHPLHPLCSTRRHSLPVNMLSQLRLSFNSGECVLLLFLTLARFTSSSIAGRRCRSPPPHGPQPHTVLRDRRPRQSSPSIRLSIHPSVRPSVRLSPFHFVGVPLAVDWWGLLLRLSLAHEQRGKTFAHATKERFTALMAWGPLCFLPGALLPPSSALPNKSSRRATAAGVCLSTRIFSSHTSNEEIDRALAGPHAVSLFLLLSRSPATPNRCLSRRYRLMILVMTSIGLHQ